MISLISCQFYEVQSILCKKVQNIYYFKVPFLHCSFQPIMTKIIVWNHFSRLFTFWPVPKNVERQQISNIQKIESNYFVHLVEDGTKFEYLLRLPNLYLKRKIQKRSKEILLFFSNRKITWSFNYVFMSELPEKFLHGLIDI